ncbi:MAG: hypothetical protein DWP98_04410 [Bacteroidetes bacterium]|nr:MAG: hypothetical protein DWP98_04410 [Bacteroidota bacterium]MBL1145822.1 hypothetical protein [Bacteroidota bacterium]NOG58616.1 archaeosortase/exosortase family protein [Bacteroidota bacterium]
MFSDFLDSIKQYKKPIFFILKMFGVYLTLQAFYDYVLSPYTNIDKYLISLIISQTEWVLSFLGYALLEPNSMYEHHVGVLDSSGVVIGNPCDGISLFILYASFLFVFKGKWWFKLSTIGFGILVIHFLNVFRIIALAIIVVYYPESLDFHHKYSFTLFVYLCIFLMWYKRIDIYKKREW